MTILELLSGIKPDWQIKLPMPPSTNTLYLPIATKGRSRMVTSAHYKKWKTCVAFMDWIESVLTYRVFITIEIQPGPGFNDRSDSNNFAKAPIDSLVANGVLVDDCKKYVAGELSFFGDPYPNGDGIVIVRVYPEAILNGIEKPKDLFEDGAMQ